MNIKTQLKIIISFILIVSVISSLTIFYSLQNYRSAVSDIQISNQIANQVFTRRIIADDYIFNGTARAKIQWYLVQDKINQLISPGVIKIHNLDERLALTKLSDQTSKSQNDFGQLVSLVESQISTSSGILEKKNFIANQL